MKKVKLTVKTVNELEKILTKYENIQEFKLGLSIARTLKNITEIMDVVRSKLMGSEAFQSFRAERQKYLMSLEGQQVLQGNVVSKINEMIEKYDVGQELKDLSAQEQAFLNEEVEVVIYPVSLACEPGYYSKDSSEKGVFLAAERIVLLDVGILEWPDDE